MRKKPTMPVLAKKYNISYEQLKGLKRKGYDIYNEDDVRKGIKERSRAKIAITKELPEDLKQNLKEADNMNDLLSTLKYRIINAKSAGDFMETKKAAECVKIFLEIDIKNKDLIHIKKIQEQIEKITAAVEMSFNKLHNDMPAQLLGLPTADMQRLLKDWATENKGQLSNAKSEIWEAINNPEEF